MGYANQGTLTGCSNTGMIAGSIGTDVFGDVTGSSQLGGIAGYSLITIEDCFNSGSVTAGQYAGGIVGYNKKAVVECVNQGNIDAKVYSAGGIVGRNENGVTVKNCSNSGTITGSRNTSWESRAGGIGGDSWNTPVENCYNTGSVSGTGSGVGGVVGNLDGNNSCVRNCYNSGKVTGYQTVSMGGIIGIDKKSLTHDNNFYLEGSCEGGVAGVDYPGEAEVKSAMAFSFGDVADLLNQGVTAENGYRSWVWAYDGLTQFSDKVTSLTFTTTPENADVELKDSEGHNVEPIISGSKTYAGLEDGETYTYTVTANDYKSVPGTFTYQGTPQTLDVSLEAVTYTIKFSARPADAKVELFDKTGKLVEAASENTYLLKEGTYSYQVSKAGYGTQVNQLIVGGSSENRSRTIRVTLEEGSTIRIETNATMAVKPEITVYKFGNVLVQPTKGDDYELSAGDYTYKVICDGYEDFEGSFTVDDEDQTVRADLHMVYDVSWYDKDKNTYLIEDKEDLIGLAMIVNGKSTTFEKDTMAGKTVQVMNDIVLNDSSLFHVDSDGNVTVDENIEVWEPIGGYGTLVAIDSIFEGTFDGMNHRIDGVYVEGKAYAGFFSAVDGTVKNITISGYINGSLARAGGIAGRGCGTFENCVNECTVYAKTGVAGGIIGDYYNKGNQKFLSLISCENKGNIRSGLSTAGGLAASATAATNVVFKNCINTGEITVKSSKGAGISAMTTTNATYENCYNLGNVTGTGSAGIALVAATIKNCYNAGTVPSGSTGGAISAVAVTKVPEASSNNYYLEGSCNVAYYGGDVAGKGESRPALAFADGRVAELLNAGVTEDNGYKTWMAFKGQTVFSYDYGLCIYPDASSAVVKLYDSNNTLMESVSNGLYVGLENGTYTYVVSRDGLKDVTGTVEVNGKPQTVDVDMEATVYVTISKDGTFKLSSDGDQAMIRVPVTVDNFDVTEYGFDSIYNSDDGPTALHAMIRAHELYNGGADGFAGEPNNTPATGNDLYTIRFWGEDTTQLNYHVNDVYPGEWLEDEGQVWGSTWDNILLNEGDEINVTMYTNYRIPMFYTWFDKKEATVRQGDKLELTLSGFDLAMDYLRPEAIAMSGSTIYVDSTDTAAEDMPLGETEFVTDENGKAMITFDEPGTYYVSARGTLEKIDNQNAIITAPGCIVTVTDRYSEEDRTAAETVEEKIDSLPETITKADKDAIDEARSAYDALTNYQKELVDNLDQLEAAEAAYEKLKEEGDFKAVDVSYRTHVQTYGWQNFVKNGAMSGTEGEAKRLEGIEIKVSGNANVGVEYQTHVQTYGWQDFVSDGAMSGTEGQYKRLEAIRIRLTGKDADKYDVYYRVHAQSYGWLDWAKNGEAAGTSGYGKRLEGIEIVVVKKGEKAPGGTERAYIERPGDLAYRTHVQSYGWQNWVNDGAMSGTEGEYKRLEGIQIQLNNPAVSGNITYRTHVQTYGWQNWVSNGAMSGTEGQSKRLEAIQIKLSGELAENYDIYYRVHAQSYGWLGWAKNGESAGTEGLSKRLEAIEIQIVPKGAMAPGCTDQAFVK